MSQSDLINILTSIIRYNKYSHCRLCLKLILDDYVRLDEKISLNSDSEYETLSEILDVIIGGINEEIPGLEAVCTDCVETALGSIRFFNKCRKSSLILKTFLENISNSLSIDSSLTGENKILYLVIDELDCKLSFEDKLSVNDKNISRLKYECLEHNKVFETLVEANAHKIAEHKTWTCNECLETFISEKELTNHDSCHRKYKCLSCSVYNSSEEGLKEHHDRVHKLYVCKDCGKSCYGLDKLQSHEEKHKIKHSCPKCGKNYTTKEFYERHVELCLKDMIDPHPIRSNMEKAFICEKCDKAYSTPGGLRVHNRFAHGNATPHVCPECGKKFTAPSYLKVHMIKHTGEKNFKCDICNNRFVSKEALLYHTRRHTGEKPYSCKICNERFVNASARAEHIKFKHVGPTLMCEICSRKFVTTHFLKQHISRHHDPTSKLYYGRNMIPPNLPVEQNMRKFIIKTENS